MYGEGTKRWRQDRVSLLTNLVGSCTVGNFTLVMATMTVHIFPVMAYQDQKRYMYILKTMHFHDQANTAIKLTYLLSSRSYEKDGRSSAWWWGQRNPLPRNAKSVEEENDQIRVLLPGEFSSRNMRFLWIKGRKLRGSSTTISCNKSFLMKMMKKTQRNRKLPPMMIPQAERSSASITESVAPLRTNVQHSKP